MKIAIGKSGRKTVSLNLALANRHGLVTGSTGVGKTVSLQLLAEGFAAAGVPVFAADVKGDLSGIALPGDARKVKARAAELGMKWKARSFPVAFWDIFRQRGWPVTTSIQEMGDLLLSSMLRLNEVQSGAMAIAFRKSEDDKQWMRTTDDLRWTLVEMLEEREEVCRKYGNVTASSLSAIQRNLLALDSQGGANLFGEPPFNINDLMMLEGRRGVVNLLHADRLMEAPKLYATFLPWLLTELFRVLPEVGDIDKPKLVFFFDEAHLLFRDAPKPLIQQIERLVRLIRSKGVGVYFVTQSPADIPDAVLAQLGNRIQHALRAYTPKDRRMIRAAADAFRPNPKVDVMEAITGMAIGEALVSTLQADGSPSPVERVKVFPPSGQIGPVTDLERQALMDQEDQRPVLEETDACQSFGNRMRRQRGMPELPPPTEPFKEGDYVKFLPDFDAMEMRVRRPILPHLISLAIWTPIALLLISWFWYEIASP